MNAKTKTERIPLSMSWSGGKDSAMALWKLLHNPVYQVVRLHTTFGEETRRVGMHGIPEHLIEMQAEALGLPLDKLYYPASGDNQAYEKAIHAYLNQLQGLGISHIAYGDIYLEDLKGYREKKLAEKSFNAVFPLWNQKTFALIGEFLDAGFRTKICAADADLIAEKWVGQDLDRDFIASLPDQVDPCGENGEFHTYCYAGPIFQKEIMVNLEERSRKTYSFLLSNGEKGEKHFWFADLKKA
ncbi:diphthine--ammonia ligase [Algoriphagus vanfongensis]|uniref:Dph6-related ATP pyrophosphatase n=1 Tax=Algoriphagus vanfongensis TaxID=426371 RepID=UPI00055342E0|nr:diphthine--ammonia ligase [Algoriphagus vanfongensis]